MGRIFYKLLHFCVILLFIVSQALPAFAFGKENTTWNSYHYSLSYDAAKQVFSEHYAQDIADTSVAVDDCLYHPLHSCADNFECLGQNLHFDSLHQESFRKQFQYYLFGTMAGLEWAKEQGDWRAYATILGTSIHAIQDITSHSSWMDDISRHNTTPFDQVISLEKANNGPNSEQGIWTGWYDISCDDCTGYAKCAKPEKTKLHHNDYNIDTIEGMAVSHHGIKTHPQNRPLTANGTMTPEQLFAKAKSTAGLFSLRWFQGMKSEVPLPIVNNTPTPQWFLDITIHTADASGAGTDGDIYVDAAGTSTLLDKSGYNDFESNDTDTYHVGPLNSLPSSIKIRNTGGGIGPDWKVGNVKVMASYSINSTIYKQGVVSTSSPGWIDSGSSKTISLNSAAVKDISPVPAPSYSEPEYQGSAKDYIYTDYSRVDYTGPRPWNFVTGTVYPAQIGKWYMQVYIKTADKSMGGTDADIYLDADGTTTLLDTPGYNDFEQGDHDAYYIGPMNHCPTSIKIRNTGGGVGPDWNVANIKVFAYYVPDFGATSFKRGVILNVNPGEIKSGESRTFSTNPAGAATQTIKSQGILNLIASIAPAQAQVPTGPAATDCLSYDPNKLKIVNEGANGWLLTDGSSRMLMLDNQNDANAALAMAKQHTSQCFIGRDNKRPNRKDYIVSYWSGNSGISTTIPQQDCIPYNPANLKIVNEGVNGWLLTDGSSRMVMLDNEQDAKAALAMAKQNTSQCFIGRDNKRPNRKDYIIQYWK